MLKDFELKIHEKAKSLATCYEKTQKDLIRVLSEVDAYKIFIKLGYEKLLLSSNERKHVTVEEMLDRMSRDFMNRHDPIEKAKSREERLQKRQERAEKLKKEVPRDFVEEFLIDNPAEETVLLEDGGNLPGPGHIPSVSETKPGTFASSWHEGMKEAVRDDLPRRCRLYP